MFRFHRLAPWLVVPVLLGACVTPPTPTPDPLSRPSTLATQVVSPANGAEPVGWDRVAQTMTPSTVMIRATFPPSAVADEGAGSGTGIVMTDDGYVVTNAHVVEGASAVTVALAGSPKERAARIVGLSSCDDLAVLKVENTDGLRPATFGRSSELKVGDEVAALGYPLGSRLGTDVAITRGIVSRLDTAIPPYESLVQTDASINPGNSGGPLVTRAAKVIGISSLGVNPTVATNVNFAISIDQARPILEDLKRGQRRLWLGMNLVPNRYEKYFGTSTGLVVAGTDSGSPASRVGVQPAFLLTRLEGTTVTSLADVCKILRSHAAGDVLKAQFLRVTDSEYHLLEGEIAIGDPKGGAELKVVRRQPKATPGTGTGGGGAQPTAAPTAAPAATSTNGKTALSFDFAADTGDWPTGKGERSDIAIRGGAYHVTITAADVYGLYTPRSMPSGRDMGIAATVQVRGNGRAGLTTRWFKNGERWSYVACWIDNSRRYGCDLTIDDKSQPLVRMAVADAIVPNQPNSLVLIHVGDGIQFAVNGTVVARGSAGAPSTGRPALYVNNTTSGSSGASFSAVKVELVQ